MFQLVRSFVSLVGSPPPSPWAWTDMSANAQKDWCDTHADKANVIDGYTDHCTVDSGFDIPDNDNA
jgi:hypothetical protein